MTLPLPRPPMTAGLSNVTAVDAYAGRQLSSEVWAQEAKARGTWGV
jgi:hypothetical protein